MEVIRRFVKIKDHQINIILPSDFNADEVEVIILPTSKEYQIPQWQIDEVRERTENYLKNLILNYFILTRLPLIIQHNKLSLPLILTL